MGVNNSRSRGRPVDLAFNSSRKLLAVLDTRSVLLMDGATGRAARRGEDQGDLLHRGSRSAPATAKSGRVKPPAKAPTVLPSSSLSANGDPRGDVARIALTGHPVPAGIAIFTRWRHRVRLFQPEQLGRNLRRGPARKLLREVPAGMAPFAVAVSSRGVAYVSNRAGKRPLPRTDDGSLQRLGGAHQRRDRIFPYQAR